MGFQIKAIAASEFEHLFEMSDVELAAALAIRMKVDKKPGYPCRISLVDAEIGEEVILVHHEHLPIDTPFRASHAVYVRPGVESAVVRVNEIPQMLQSRVLSLRGFTQAGMLTNAELVDGREVGVAIERMFEDPTVSFIHIHFAKPGCFAARVNRG